MYLSKIEFNLTCVQFPKMADSLWISVQIVADPSGLLGLSELLLGGHIWEHNTEFIRRAVFEEEWRN